MVMRYWPVVSVDYTNDSMSASINNAVSNPYDKGQCNVYYDLWKTWIFEIRQDCIEDILEEGQDYDTSKYQHAMIASSDGQVLRNGVNFSIYSFSRRKLSLI